MTSGKKIAFTICAANYLGKANALMKSVSRHCPNYEFYIVLIDEPQAQHEVIAPDSRIISVEVMGTPLLREMRNRYDVVEFSTAIKPFCFQHLFSSFPGVEQILYLDPDILVFHNFSAIDDEMKNADILLTPHLLTPNLWETSHAELRIAPTGLYNLGFIGVKRSVNSNLFLQWWSKKLEKHSVCDHKEGLFYDQNWATYAPLYFDRVSVSKNPGLNVAVWNLSERALSQGPDGFVINRNHPLVFFHFSQFRIDSNHGPGLPLADWGVPAGDQILQELCNSYKKELIEAQHAKFAGIPYLRPGRNSPARLCSILFGRILKWLAKKLSHDFRTLIRRQIQGI